MTVFDLSPAQTTGITPYRGMIPLLAAVALLVLLGLPALMAPPAQENPQDWHGNSAAAQPTR
ncbi:hypothetical protein ACFMBG_05480 [Leisingera sp. D0M16]|uniref:hypothetical protein n=1 Tax=Leisingera coralii TaxID=3351347 RepID=UPI003B816B04